MKSVPFRGLVVLAIRAVGVVASLLVTVVLARSLGVKQFGTYGFIFAIISVAALPAQFGLPELVVRETARALAGGRIEAIRPLWRWSNLVCGAISLVIFLALLGWVTLWGLVEARTMFWAAALVPLMAFGKLRSAALRGLGHDIWGQLPEYALRPALFVLVILFFASFALPITVEKAFAAQAVAYTIATGFGLAILWRLSPSHHSSQTLPLRSGAWIRTISFIGVTGSLLVFNDASDVIMLGFLSSEEEVGRYRLAATFAAVITLGLQTLNEFSMPYISKYFEKNNLSKMESMAINVSRVSFICALTVVIALYAFGDYMIDVIFGKDFSKAFPILIVLSVGYLTNAFFGPVVSLLIVGGRERLVASVTALGSITNLVLNYVFIPSYGAVGAAVSTSATILLVRLAMFFLVKRHLGMSCAAISLGRATV